MQKIQSILRRQVIINMEDHEIRIERACKHGNLVFYIWTHIEPSESIHPTIETTVLLKDEVLTRIELISEYLGTEPTDAEKLAIDQLFRKSSTEFNQRNLSSRGYN